MLSRRSYVRLFTLAVLLTGSYVGLRADDEEMAGTPDCYTTGGNHAIVCYSGQVRIDETQRQMCRTACAYCDYGSTVGYYHSDPGSAANGPGCDWILWCQCGTGVE